MSKNIKKSWLMSGIGLIVILAIYLVGVVYFNGKYLPMTKIGGTSIAAMPYDTAESYLENQLKGKVIDIYENDQKLGSIDLSQVTGQTDFQADLKQIADQQNAYAWPFAAFMQEDANLSNESVQMDLDKLNTLLVNMGVDNQNRTPSQDAYITKNESGFSIVGETYGNQVDLEKLKSYLLLGAQGNNLHVELNLLYQVANVKQDNAELIATKANLDKMLASQITLTFDGRSETIPSDLINQWVNYQDGATVIDREGIENYIRELNYSYSGLFLGRNFNSTYYGQVWVQPGTYGWYIDRIAETDLIEQEILAGSQVIREATIGGSGYGLGDSVGSSYVEVSIDAQMMWIYSDGQLVLSTPVVTGLPGTNTVPGAYQVWNKESPSVLVGYNPHYDREYQQPVDYWIAFDDNAQGIHDANWQPYFGGTAYLTSGSLGCINTPPGIMPQVYEWVYYGMPVIIY